MRIVLLFAAALFLSTPVFGATPAKTAEQEPAASPPPDMAAFARGAKAWGENCARCHNMRDPKEFTDRQWKVIGTHMRLRVGLDGKQVRDITIFLQGSNQP